MKCPKCGSSDQLDMSGDTWLCLDCRNEYATADGLAAARGDVDTGDGIMSTDPVAAAVLSATTVDDVLDYGAHDVMRLSDMLDADDERLHVSHWAGQFVKSLHGDDIYLCTEDEGGDTIAVQGEHGPIVPVKRANYELIGFDPDALAPVVGAETVTEDQPFDPAIFAVAALAITQGLACLADDEDQTLLNPRIGWLPPPCNQVPEVEQGVAYAIALLVRTYQLDREGVEQIAATLMEGAQAPETETVQ